MVASSERLLGISTISISSILQTDKWFWEQINLFTKCSFTGDSLKINSCITPTCFELQIVPCQGMMIK